MESPQPDVPPLTLSAVKLRYPRLFREYCFLSDREKESMADMGDTDPVVDPVTGQCTVISFTDFTKPLEDNGECPMKTDSEANKFCIFLWKVLNSCESGSIGGDACRQFDVLNCALDDTLAMTSVGAKFEHLLGWTAAATNHGLHALLYRGDPDRNRSLFKVAGDEWKKVFDRTANNAVNGVDEAFRKFAIWMCESLQKLLKDAKKEYGDHAKYAFNFMRKPRPRKVPVDAVAKNNISNAAPASSASINHVIGEGQIQSASVTASVTVTKHSKDAKLGLGIAQEKGATTIKVTKIADTSIFQGTALKEDMILETINGKSYASFAEGSSLLKDAEGQLTIVARIVASDQCSDPADVAKSVMAKLPAPAESDLASASSSFEGRHQKENSVPASKTLSSESSDSDESKAWEQDGFIPMSGGKQKSPSVVRMELQQYIDLCRANRTMTQAKIIEEMGVNGNTFRRFMNPKTYKDEWSATQNGTYWAAAKLLAKKQYEKEKGKNIGAKRKSMSSDEDSIKKAKEDSLTDITN